MNYKKYLIKSTDQFDPYYFPRLMDDLDTISEAMNQAEVSFKTDMLLSFLRDRHIKEEWAQGSPELAALLNSGSLPLSDLQSMFESCSTNPSFSKQLEDYIRERMKGPVLM